MEPDKFGRLGFQSPPSHPHPPPSGSGIPSTGLAVVLVAAAWMGVGWWLEGTWGTYKADASMLAWHQGAHVGGAAEGCHHGHVELLQDSGRWPVRAQLAPAHGHTLHPFTHALVLGGQAGHLHVGVDGGHPTELQQVGRSSGMSQRVGSDDPRLSGPWFPQPRLHHGPGMFQSRTPALQGASHFKPQFPRL